MAQAQITEKLKKLQKQNTVATQTGYDYEFNICLTKAKRVHFCYSDIYKEYVVNFNYGGTCQKFKLTKNDWNIFRDHFETIDKIFGNHDRNI